MCLNNNKVIVILFLSVLLSQIALLQSSMASPLDQEPNDFDRKSYYERYFSSRFGTPDNRPPSDVLEQRCMNAFREAIAIVPRTMDKKPYYAKIASLWSDCASAKSVRTLEKVLTACYWIEVQSAATKVLQRRSLSVKKNAVNWGAVWKTLSKAWLRVEQNKLQNKAKKLHTLLLNAMTVNGVCVEPSVLRDQFMEVGVPLRDGLFNRLIKEKWKLRNDIYLWSLLDGDATIFDPEASKTPFRPSRKEIILMLKSGKQVSVDVAQSYAADHMPTLEILRQTLISDLRSNEFSRILGGVVLLPALASESSGLAPKNRKELLEVLNERLDELRKQHAQTQGKTINVNVVDTGSQRLAARYSRLRIPFIIEALLEHTEPSEALVANNKPMFEENARWLRMASENLPGDVPDGTISLTLEQWRPMLESK